MSDSAHSLDSTDEQLRDLVASLASTSERESAAGILRRIVSLPRTNPQIVRMLRDRCRDFGFHAAATKFAKELVDLAPTSIDAHVLSGLFETQGQSKFALAYAEIASDLDPGNLEFLVRRGILLNTGGDHHAAAAILERALEVDPDNLDAIHNASFAHERIGDIVEAYELSNRAFQSDRGRIGYAIHAANLMMRLKEYRLASDYLASVREYAPTSAILWRTHSGCLTQLGELEQALEMALEACSLEPFNSEFRIHHAGLLAELGRYSDAYKIASEALAADPGNSAIKRQLITICLELGDNSEAIAKAAELLKENPDHDEYLSCMQHVLYQKKDNSVGIGEIIRQKRSLASRRRFRERSALETIVSYLRVIYAVFLREMRARFSESRLGYLWVVVEPMIHMVALAVVFQFTMKGRPPLGDSFFFFYFTGLIPYQLFIHTVEQVSNTVMNNRALLQLPPVSNLAAMYAKALLELYTTLLVIGLFMAGFWIFGVDPTPHYLFSALGALFFAWILSLGVGIINGVINPFFHAWHHIFQIVHRLLYFTSGIFYVPAMMPEEFRAILWWNPMLHAVDWFRIAFFTSYHPPWMDPSYLVLFSIAALALGLALESTYRKKLRKLA